MFTIKVVARQGDHMHLIRRQLLRNTAPLLSLLFFLGCGRQSAPDHRPATKITASAAARQEGGEDVQPPLATPVAPPSYGPLAPLAGGGVAVNVLASAGLKGGGYPGKEPTISVDPLDASHMVIVSFSGSAWRTGGNSSLFFSSDGGTSWAYRTTIPPPPGVPVGDDCPCDQMIAYGPDGVLYGSFLTRRTTTQP